MVKTHKSSLLPRPPPRFYLIFLHGCEINLGGVLAMRLPITSALIQSVVFPMGVSKYFYTCIYWMTYMYK